MILVSAVPDCSWSDNDNEGFRIRITADKRNFQTNQNSISCSKIFQSTKNKHAYPIGRIALPSFVLQPITCSHFELFEGRSQTIAINCSCNFYIKSRGLKEHHEAISRMYIYNKRFGLCSSSPYFSQREVKV